MIGFGIFLLILGVLNPKFVPLAGIGVICIVVGLILQLSGRRHYY
ncbi:MAG: hypothetical protein QOJ63_3265 [Solirubrobacteraceae bacterium]|jgi:membrane-bound ClpP family serine protease|nr:hypothetical protein [Solirubrobacteraceae bacterium]MEA2192613.1 hypothetical protein [Solirubrobacteraceae bacterium]